MTATTAGYGPHPFMRVKHRSDRTDLCWCGQREDNRAIHPAVAFEACTVCGCYPLAPHAGCRCVAPSCHCPDPTTPGEPR